jgi:hypothetical protein
LFGGSAVVILRVTTSLFYLTGQFIVTSGTTALMDGCALVTSLPIGASAYRVARKVEEESAEGDWTSRIAALSSIIPRNA